MSWARLELHLATASLRFCTPPCTHLITPPLYTTAQPWLTCTSSKAPSEETPETTTEIGLQFLEELKAARDKR